MRVASLWVVLSAAACAPAVQEVKHDPLTLNGDVAASMAAMQAQMVAIRQAQESAERGCEPVLRAEIGWEEERRIGELLSVNLLAKTGHVFIDGMTEKNPETLRATKPTLTEGERTSISAYVAIVGRNLTRASSRPELPWTFGVLENDTPDSFSEPGGYVFVTTGLLKKMSNEAQLAGVLAHQVGHVVRKDALARYRKARHTQCVVAKTAAWTLQQGNATGLPASSMAAAQFAAEFEGDPTNPTKGGFVAFIMDAVMSSMQLGYDKEAEFETDRTALELVSFAGYDAAEYEKFLTAVPQQNHPAAAERAEKLKALREGPLKDFAHGAAKPDLAKVFAPLSK